MAENFLSPGVIVRELRAGVPQIRGVPTSVGAYVIRSLRGPVDKAIFTDSPAKAQRIFGTYDPNSFAMEQVDGFFRNGGSALYLVRAQPTSGGGSNVKATVTIDTVAAADAAKFDAVGPGSSYNSVKVKTANEDTIVGLAGSGIAANIPAAAIPSVQLTAATRARVAVGDTLKFNDGATTIRAVVARIDDNTVVFQDSPTAGLVMTVALTTVTLETWNVSIIEAGRILFGPVKSLRSSPLSVANYFVTRLNTNDDELVVTVTDMVALVGAGGLDNRPVNTVSGGDLLLTGATMATFADADYIGVSASGTGLFALDKKRDVRIVAIPGVTGSTTGAVSKGLLDYCTAREDCVAVMAPPVNTAPSAALTYKNTSVGGTSYGIMYYPYLYIISPLTGQKALSPPEGFVMGMIARTDRERGVAKAPAGELVGRLIGTVDLERELTPAEKDLLYPANINPIENIEGVGQCVMGSRTMETGEFNQINVRRTFIYFRVSIQQGTRFVLFEPNDTSTRAKVRRTVAAFLNTEWKKGNLEGATLEEAFFVICDKSNNPLSTINQGKMFISVGVNIPKTTEFVIIEIQQDQRGIQAELGI